jgi:hypothetical protein
MSADLAPRPELQALADVPTEHLERQISELAGHIYAATCRWLQMVAEYDARRSWSDRGAKSCAQWLSYRCGIAPVTARQQVAVANRLTELPRVTAAFSAGQLSYSKVRAISRVATPENEDYLVEVALDATAHQVEKLTRSYKGVLRTAELEATNDRHAERFLTYHHDHDGCLVINARLSPEDGAVVIAALEAARKAIAATPPSKEPADPPQPTSGSQVLTASAEATSPEDRDATRAEDLGAAQVHSPSAHNADALVAVAETFLAAGLQERPADDRHLAILHVDLGTLCDDDDGDCHLEDGPRLAPETARRLCCDASVVALIEKDGDPLSVERQTRVIPVRIRRALHARDKGCCTFPGCQQKAFLDGHHILHWAQGGPTSLANLALLCRFHHRLLHEGGYDMRVEEGRFAFRRPDGSVIPAAPATIAPKNGDIVALNIEQGTTIDSETCVTTWVGDQMNYSTGVGWLLRLDGVLPMPEDWRD